MTVNKQKVLDEILAEQKPVWDENRKSYPKPAKNKSVLGVHKPTETENSFHDFQTKMNAKMNAEKTCLEWSRQLVAAKTETERTLILGALEKALITLDEYQV